METLTSLKNPKVLAWKSLKDKKGREEQHAFLVEGVRMVREALLSSFQVKALLLREGFEPAFPLPGDIPAYLLPEHHYLVLHHLVAHLADLLQKNSLNMLCHLKL